MWLDRVKQKYGDGLCVNWRSFSLDQVHREEKANVKVWDLPNFLEERSLLSLISGEAARLQGIDLYEKYHMALLRARHGGNARISLNKPEPLLQIARNVGLDVNKFEEDLENPEAIGSVIRDHTEAVDVHGVFGTPTFLFEGRDSVYVKTFIPPIHESVEFFERFVGLMSGRSYLGELKRPQPPWPKGAVKY